MARDILEQLFYGEIIPWENSPENTQELKQLNQKMAQLSDALDERLDDETKALLDQYLSGRADIEAVFCCDSFKTGFRIGAQFILEVLKAP